MTERFVLPTTEFNLPDGGLFVVRSLSSVSKGELPEAVTELLRVHQSGMEEAYTSHPYLDSQGRKGNLTKDQLPVFYDPRNEEEVAVMKAMARGTWNRTPDRNAAVVTGTIVESATREMVAMANVRHGGGTCEYDPKERPENENCGEGYSAELRELHVARRGNGFGTIILMAIMDALHERHPGYGATMRLDVARENKGAQRLYRNIGMRATGHEGYRPQSDNTRVYHKEMWGNITKVQGKVHARVKKKGFIVSDRSR